MSGVITKKHFFKIWKHFGLQKAMRVLMSTQPVALMALMMD